MSRSTICSTSNTCLLYTSMPIKLIQVQRKLNVGINTVVEFLRKKGFEVEDNNCLLYTSGGKRCKRLGAGDPRRRRISEADLCRLALQMCIRDRCCPSPAPHTASEKRAYCNQRKPYAVRGKGSTSRMFWMPVR